MVIILEPLTKKKTACIFEPWNKQPSDKHAYVYYAQ